MKYLVWVISGINLYFGFRAFLNAIHVLQTSKYSQATTVVFAILFLGLGAYGVYAARTNVNPRTGLLIGIGPWVLAPRGAVYHSGHQQPAMSELQFGARWKERPPGFSPGR